MWSPAAPRALRAGALPSVTLAALAALALAACDIPTGPPVITSKWAVPVAGDSVAVADVLPPEVTATPSAFLVHADPAASHTTLGVLCGDGCAEVEGQYVPKPAFAGTTTTDVPLPATVGSVTLGAGGTIDLRLDNGFGFDPLRPSASARGRLIVAVASQGRTITADTADGAAVALPSGGALVRRLPLPAGAVLAGAVRVTVTLESPAGDPATIDGAEAFVVTATPGTIAATAAAVVVDRQPVGFTTAPFRFDGVDQEVRDRIDGATLALDLTNPIHVAGTLAVRLVDPASGAPVVDAKAVTLSGADETLTLQLDAAEIARVLDAGRVALAVEGEVSATAADRLASVLPTSAVRFAPRLLLHTRTSTGS